MGGGRCREVHGKEEKEWLGGIISWWGPGRGTNVGEKGVLQTRGSGGDMVGWGKSAAAEGGAGGKTTDREEEGRCRQTTGVSGRVRL